jgi:uncharacterized membrane protein YkoI
MQSCEISSQSAAMARAVGLSTLCTWAALARDRLSFAVQDALAPLMQRLLRRTVMNRNKVVSLVVAIALGAGATAFAAQNGENDAVAIRNAKLSLVDAVGIAQRHTSGQASRAEFENTKQGWVYDVEVVNGRKVFDVRVDATKGTVLSSSEDKTDRGGDADKEDND